MQPGNYELQQQYLDQLQQEISGRLFEAGVVSRIISSEGAHQFGYSVDDEGLSQLDKLFVPTVHFKTIDGREERVLRLCTIETDESGNGRSFAYRALGEIDEQGFLHPDPGVQEEDVWAVYAEAEKLEELRDSELPNLSSTLLHVNNPRTAMSLKRD